MEGRPSFDENGSYLYNIGCSQNGGTLGCLSIRFKLQICTFYFSFTAIYIEPLFPHNMYIFKPPNHSNVLRQYDLLTSTGSSKVD